MNDATEVEHAFSILWYLTSRAIGGRDSLDAYEAVRSALLDDLMLFIGSFSKSPNLLSQWRAYASENGVSIGFPADLFRADTGAIRTSLKPVIYAEKSQLAAVQPLSAKISRILAGCDGDYAAAKKLVRVLRDEFCLVAPFLKHGGFTEEREVRFVAFGENLPVHSRQGHYGETRYIRLSLNSLFSHVEQLDVPISYVLTGPSPFPDCTVRRVADLFYKHRTKFFAIFDCGIPLR